MSGADLKPGVRLSGHLLSEELGAGGYSRVFKAQPDGGGPPVALKVAVRPELVEVLRSEGCVLRRLRGPRFVEIIAEHLDADPPFFVLGLCAGGDLRQLLERSPLKRLAPDRVLDLATRILEGIAFAHEEGLVHGDLKPENILLVLDILARVHREGIVHGDLKPENVLFDDRRGVALSDFGLSRRIAQRSATLSVSLSLADARIAGTLDYMAPEQRAGEKPTTRSDVYAAGVILYELLTGERPQGVFAMPSERDPTVPPVVDRLLAMSLAPDPRHRFSSAGAMVEHLRSRLGTEWEGLAAAHARVSDILLWTRIGREVMSGYFLASIGLVLVGIATRGTPDACTAFVGTAAGLFASGLIWRRARGYVAKRRSVLQALRRRIAAQIRAEGQWSGRSRSPVQP